MNPDFEYRKTDKGACVTKVLAPGAVVIIPEEIDGTPVVELKGHLFAGGSLEEVFLPRNLVKIGRYAFYNCESLRAVHFYHTMEEVGGGLFNGCGRVSDLYVHMDGGERSLLRDFVTELNCRLTVHCMFAGAAGADEEKARLIFPLYYDEAVENTPARIISSSVHGSGQRYRYCFESMKIQYERYDGLFEYEVNEEGVLPASELALCRLMFPHALSAGAEERYTRFLLDNRVEILLGNIGRPDAFKWILKVVEGAGAAKREIPGGGAGAARREMTGGGAGAAKREMPGGGAGAAAGAPGLTGEELDKLIEAAGAKRQAELLSILMELRHERCKPARKSFDL